MANAISMISKRAKAIQKMHPSMSWKSCIKKASAEYRGGKLGRATRSATKRVKKKRTVRRKRKVGAYKVIERGETKSTPAKKVYRVSRSRKGTFRGTKKVGATRRSVIYNNPTVIKRAKATALKDAKVFLEAKLSDAMLRHYHAKTVKATKAAARLIAKYKRQLKALS